MHMPKKNKNTLILALLGDLLNTEILTARNNQIAILEKKLFKSNFSIIFIHHTKLLIDKLSNHLENTPKRIPNKNIIIVLIILFLSFKLSSTFLILFKISFILSLSLIIISYKNGL